MIPFLEWTITGLGFMAGWLLGKNNRMGWLVNIFSQVIWVYVAVATQQWPFVVTSVVYAYINLRGWLRWRKNDRTRFTAESSGIS